MYGTLSYDGKLFKTAKCLCDTEIQPEMELWAYIYILILHTHSHCVVLTANVFIQEMLLISRQTQDTTVL